MSVKILALVVVRRVKLVLAVRIQNALVAVKMVSVLVMKTVLVLVTMMKTLNVNAISNLV
jgi:hypothetical protein